MKLKHLSASRIKTFEKCELEYFAKYDLEIADDYTHPLTIMGKAYHKVFEVSTTALLLENKGIYHPAWRDPFQMIDPAMRKYAVEEQYRNLLVELTQNALDWGYFRKVTSSPLRAFLSLPKALSPPSKKILRLGSISLNL